VEHGPEILVIALIARAAELPQCGDPAGLFSFTDTEGIAIVLQAPRLYCFRAMYFFVGEQS